MKVSIMDFNGKKEPQCGLHVRVRFASKADIRAAIRHVRFTPECSALAYVCFGPIADIPARPSKDQLKFTLLGIMREMARFRALQQRYAKMVLRPAPQSPNRHAWAKMPISPFAQSRHGYSPTRHGESRRRNPRARRSGSLPVQSAFVLAHRRQ